MNQRVVVIVLVALFATCFVGSGAVAALTLINKVIAEAKDFTTPPEEPAEASTLPEAPVDVQAIADPALDPDGELLSPDDDEPAGFVAPELGTAEFAVFHSEKLKLDPWAALQKAARGTRVQVFKHPAPPTAVPPYLELRDLTVKDYAVIGGDTLEAGRGLTPAMKAALPRTKRVSVLDASLPLEGMPLFELSKVVAAFAQATGGVLWDEEAQEYLSLEAWKIRRINSWEKGLPHVSMNFTVFVDSADKGVEIRSAGLRHLGLAELELKAISRSSRDAAVSLLNATAQALVEKKAPALPGPLTVDLAQLRHVQHRKNLEEKTFPNAQRVIELVLVPGEGKVPTLAITFPGQGSPTERVEDAIATFFGAKDHVDQVEHDEALNEISRQQLEIYKTTIKSRFRKGLKYGEVLLVKAPFATASGGQEWMWVEVTKLAAGGKIEGLLSNDPDDVPALRSGTEVVVDEAQLFDWMMKEADGTTTGNETGKVMQERLAK